MWDFPQSEIRRGKKLINPEKLRVFWRSVCMYVYDMNAQCVLHWLHDWVHVVYREFLYRNMIDEWVHAHAQAHIHTHISRCAVHTRIHTCIDACIHTRTHILRTDTHIHTRVLAYKSYIRDTEKQKHTHTNTHTYFDDLMRFEGDVSRTPTASLIP